MYSPLNTALHQFRAQFASKSNSELAFNPFYLLEAGKYYQKRYDSFNGEDNFINARRCLFWRQVIGYIQRHLPACYLQAFAQGFLRVLCFTKLNRDFEFSDTKGIYITTAAGALNPDLGYQWAFVNRRALTSLPDLSYDFYFAWDVAKFINNRTTKLSSIAAESTLNSCTLPLARLIFE